MTAAARRNDGAESRWLPRVHAVLLGLLAVALGLLLWRTYGFAPLRIVEAGR